VRSSAAIALIPVARDGAKRRHLIAVKHGRTYAGSMQMTNVSCTTV
jgi:hypothetical protein